MAKYGKMNVKGLKELQKQLEDMKDSEVLMQECAKELAARLLSRVKQSDRTPTGDYPKSTGKVGGTLKRGWKAGEIEKVGDSYRIEVFNPVEYASYVEYGHRTRNHKDWVQGKFMMTLSAREIEQSAPDILEKKILRYLKKAFK